jgi:serine phosphatase RsbU (regulator of sigma subunit)/PAS domain-containing protein
MADGPDLPHLADVRALLDADPHGCALACSVRDTDGTIVDFTLVHLNAAGARFLGRPPDELVGRTYRELWPETVTDGTLPRYRQVVNDRVPLNRTVYYDRATVSGHFEFRVVPFGDGFVARFVDLTRLTLGPEASAGVHLYDALDAAFDGFALLRAVRDDTGAIEDFTREYVNQVGAKLAGRTVEDLVGGRIRDSDGDTRLFGPLCQVTDDGEVWQERLTAPGTAQVWEVKIARVDVDVVAVSYRDITDHVDQQEQLARGAAAVHAAAIRTDALQAVTAALVAASTPDEVYAAMGTVLRPSAGGNGLVVLLAEDGRLVLRYHAGYEPDVVSRLRELPLTHPYPAVRVGTDGEPRFLRSPAEFAAEQPDTTTAISGGGRRAWAFLPLSTGGQLLGALVIGYAQPRDFDAGERADLMAFSRLAAQALQRSLLFQAQMSIAADLQRTLLPAALPPLRGARHAVRYLPWTHGADVGGDWYDVIPLGPDTAALVIGDVAGHSVTAAATMGQLRNALRAYAVDGHGPAAVLRRVNDLLVRLEPEAMATCCYLELNLADGTVTGVLAGHPAPILRAGDETRRLPLPPQPPLGVRGARYHDTALALPPHSDLVLYTDGLVEDRQYPIDRGMDDLCAAVRSAPAGDPHALIDHILHAGVGPTPRRDDVAILALTVDTACGGRPAVHARRP